jgi:hypothetical protein
MAERRSSGVSNLWNVAGSGQELEPRSWKSVGEGPAVVRVNGSDRFLPKTPVLGRWWPRAARQGVIDPEWPGAVDSQSGLVARRAYPRARRTARRHRPSRLGESHGLLARDELHDVDRALAIVLGLTR